MFSILINIGIVRKGIAVLLFSFTCFTDVFFSFFIEYPEQFLKISYKLPIICTICWQRHMSIQRNVTTIHQMRWTQIFIPYFSVGVNFTYKQKYVHTLQMKHFKNFHPNINRKRDRNLSPSKVVTFLYIGTCWVCVCNFCCCQT